MDGGPYCLAAAECRGATPPELTITATMVEIYNEDIKAWSHLAHLTLVHLNLSAAQLKLLLCPCSLRRVCYCSHCHVPVAVIFPINPPNVALPPKVKQLKREGLGIYMTLPQGSAGQGCCGC